MVRSCRALVWHCKAQLCCALEAIETNYGPAMSSHSAEAVRLAEHFNCAIPHLTGACALSSKRLPAVPS